MCAKNPDFMFEQKATQEMYRWKTNDNENKIVHFEFIYHSHANVYLIYQLKMHGIRLRHPPMIYEMV